MSGNEIENLVVKAQPAGISETSQKFEGLQEDIDETADEMGDATGQFEDLAATWKGALGAVLAGVAVAIGGLLSQVPILGQVASGVGAVINGLAFQLDKRLRPALQPIASGLFELGNAIAAGDWAKVEQVLTSAVQAIQNVDWGQVIKDIVTGITSFLRGVDWLGLGADIIKAIAKGIATWVRETDWKGWAMFILNEIKTTLITNVNWLQVGKNIITGIADGIVGASSFVLGGIEDIGQMILNEVNGLMNQAVSWGKSIVINFAAGIKNWASDIATEAGNVADLITSEISKLVNMAVEWGEGIIDGIIKGFKNSVDDLKKAVDNNIAQPIRDRLPSSPAKTGPLSDLDQTGPGLVNTVAQGISANSGTAGSAADNLAGSMTPNMSTGNALDNPKVFMDGREVTSSTGRYRQDETSRRGRNG